MAQVKLAVIGGGSVNWMLALMCDLYLVDEIDGGEIRLVDPNVEHVNAVAEMLRSFNRSRQKDFQVTVHTDRREAMRAAQYVICTFSPGSMEAFEADLELPVKYGIRQPVSMTVGPCGISAALRTVPVAYEIVEEMEAVCPRAWLFNVTNPMSVVTRAMNLASRTVKVVGLCHEFHAFGHIVGPMIGLPQRANMSGKEYLYSWLAAQGVEVTAAGLNHLVWVTGLTRHGEDLLPVIRRQAQEKLDLRPEDDRAIHGSRVNHHAAKLALCRTFGYLPIAGDRHLVEFWPSLCNARNGYAGTYDVAKTTVDARRLRKHQQLEQIRRIAQGHEQPAWTASGEELVDILSAIHQGKSTIAIVNAPNQGQIDNLPRDIVVETFASVGPDGVAPQSSGALPGPLASMARLHADVHELTLQAALNGDRALLVQAMTLDPLSAAADFREIAAMTDELLMANRAYLPRFFA